MYYEDEYGYYETSEADNILCEAAEKLKNIVKQDVQSYYENIIAENEKLKKENTELRNKSIEVSNKERVLENKIKNHERNFIKDKFSNLLKDIITVGYKVDYNYIKNEKCTFCDDDRKIEYTTPQGDKFKMKCKCDNCTKKYEPKKLDLNEIKINKHEYYPEGKIWTKVIYNDSYDDQYVSLSVDEIKHKFELENIKDNYNAVYSSEEECLKHCNYLNENNI